MIGRRQFVLLPALVFVPKLAHSAEILLPTEPATGWDLRHADVLLVEAEQRGNLPPILPRSLALREDAQAIVVGHSE